MATVHSRLDTVPDTRVVNTEGNPPEYFAAMCRGGGVLLAVAGELLGPVGGGLLLPHLHPPACSRHPPHSGLYHANRGHWGMSAVVSSDKLVPGQRWVLTLLGEKIQNPNVVRFVSMKAGEGLHVCGLSSSARARIDTSHDT